MNDTNTENLPPVENKTRVSYTINGKVTVKFHDLKDFITLERGGSLYGMAKLMGYDPSTFSNTLRGVGRNPSSIVTMLRLEKLYEITIEGDPYR